MTTTNVTPDIRIGLIGLTSSGKTSMVAMLNDVYWDMEDNERAKLEFRDRETARLFERAKKALILESKFLPQTRVDEINLYCMIYERSEHFLGFGGFRHYLDILDVAGDYFTSENETIYSEWLAKCNALIVLIDGQVLLKSHDGGKKSRRKNKLVRQQIEMFHRLSNLIKLYLQPAHKGKHKIYVAFCVSKYDLFEADPLPPPEDVVRKKLFSVYDIVERIRHEEKDWIESKWYGFSSIGFVWDDMGSHYVDRDGNPVTEGKRVTQYYEENDKAEAEIYDSTIIRPEGIRTILEDIRSFIKSNRYVLPILKQEEVDSYLKQEVDNYFAADTDGDDEHGPDHGQPDDDYEYKFPR